MAEKKSKQYVSDNAQLMAEWDWENNQTLSPYELTYGSAKKVWWKCINGHRWEASPNHRSRGRGCPFCARVQGGQTRSRNMVERRGSLADIDPLLSQQWHPSKNGVLSPKNITIGSGKKVWWICEQGHEWEAAINSRRQGVGCPVCSGHKILVGYNDLATEAPDLAAQWHPSKNGDLAPTDITASSDKKVWWLCEKDHEWEARIANRSNGCNCPICSGRKTLVGYNDLSSRNPELAKQWHPIKNGVLQPSDVTEKSNKKVWWLCDKGHEWQASISHRSNGRRCPVCFGETKTSFPEQAIFFYLQQVTTAYNRYKIDPRTEVDIYLPEYKIGIEYDGAFFHQGANAERREKRKQEVLDNHGILLICVKEVSEEFNNEAAPYVLYISQGPSDEELTVIIKNLLSSMFCITNVPLQIDIDIKRDRQKIYAQYIENEKERSLLRLDPELAEQWHPTKNGTLLPEHVSLSSNKKVWWRCEHGHEWEAIINSRSKGIGCPYCTGKRAQPGYNDLATVNPVLVAEWHPTKNGNLTPSNVLPFSNKKVWWICEQGHEWEAMIYDRSNGCNCPICSGRKVLAGYNDLATVNPQLASQWHPAKNLELTPVDVTAGSNKKVWWCCSNGHEWEAAIHSRNAGYGCPYCTGQKVVVGINDLATVNPKLAAQWHPIKNGELKSTDVAAGSKKKVWWLCKKGHEWEAAIYSRNAGRGCPTCYQDRRQIKPKVD